MKKNRVNPEKIAIRNIQLYKSILNISENDLGSASRVMGYSFSVSHKTGVNSENDLVRYQFQIKFQATNEQNVPLEINGEFGIEFLFHINNFEELIIEKNKEFTLDRILDNTLLSIAYSTSRGIIIQETRATIIGGVILPIINPSTLISK